MLVYGRHGHLKQLRDLGLRQPDGLILEPALDAGAAILCLIQEDFTAGGQRSQVAHMLIARMGRDIIRNPLPGRCRAFGSLSKLYGGLLNDDKRDIAGRFGIHPGVMGSWLHTLVYVRNICAHHARLWNRELAIAPRLPDKDPCWQTLGAAHPKRLASILFLLNALLTRLPSSEAAAADWRRRVEDLLAMDPGVPRFHESMGLPPDWTRHPLWR